DYKFYGFLQVENEDLTDMLVYRSPTKVSIGVKKQQEIGLLILHSVCLQLMKLRY
ncbi:unnamed protein product, partial [Musa acuminata var. zebrina]